jgi:ribosomal protein L37AE/L43A
LRFRDTTLGEAVPLALRSPALRAEFRRVLATLGEQTRCPSCERDVFAVPLYRLRGLDDLHAWVCPACGHSLKSYWMPRGQDVQSVLNDAFLDLELLTEWTFRLGRASVSTQLLPEQLETLSVGHLKRRFVEDVLLRHGVDVSEKQVRLRQGKRPVPERRWLADCATRTFSVAFAEGATVSMADALEQVRYRIRTRFRPESSRPTVRP